MNYYKKEMGDETGSMNSMEALRLMDDARRMARTGYEIPMATQKRMAKYGIEPAMYGNMEEAKNGVELTGKQRRIQKRQIRNNTKMNNALMDGNMSKYDKFVNRSKKLQQKYSDTMD